MYANSAVNRYGGGATETDVLCFPDDAITAGTHRGILFCHGAEGVGVQVIDPTIGYRPLVVKLVDHGKCPLVAADLGSVLNTSDVWGNDTGMTRMDSAWSWLKSSTGGKAKTDKCVLVGGSMGGLMAVNWAYRNPTLVAAIAIVIPALDLQDIYEQNRSGLAAQITAAYGGAPTYSQRSPMQLASGLAGIPTKVWYATDDPVTPSTATNTTFASSVGGSASTQSMGAVGHTFSAVDPNQVLAFIGPYL